MVTDVGSGVSAAEAAVGAVVTTPTTSTPAVSVRVNVRTMAGTTLPQVTDDSLGA